MFSCQKDYMQIWESSELQCECPFSRPVFKLEPSNVHKVTGIAFHQDTLLFEDDGLDAVVIRTDTAMAKA